MGYEISRVSPPVDEILHEDMEDEFRHMYEQCRAYTMTSLERMYALYLATHYISERNIEGDIVECGVWRGGSAMLCALVLSARGDTGRNIWLYDTYKGMTEPQERDVRLKAGRNHPKSHWRRTQNGSVNQWAYSPMHEVRANMKSCGYPEAQILLVQGKVEDTIPKQAPERIALLRLDTDWYESTKHELDHLYPRLSSHGVLIVDDYGYWKGQKDAVDEYFGGNKPLLIKIDRPARIALKP